MMTRKCFAPGPVQRFDGQGGSWEASPRSRSGFAGDWPGRGPIDVCLSGFGKPWKLFGRVVILSSRKTR